MEHSCPAIRPFDSRKKLQQIVPPSQPGGEGVGSQPKKKSPKIVKK